jgi:manganese transport protein
VQAGGRSSDAFTDGPGKASVAARAFHTHALSNLATIGQAHAEPGKLAGGFAALAFAGALLASGTSSSSVGTYAGQVVMAGFTSFRVPLIVRRAITMLPALAILAAGANVTGALVLSRIAVIIALNVLILFQQLTAA